MADDIFKGSTVTTESAADDVFRGALVYTTPVADDVFRGRLVTTTQPAGDMLAGGLVYQGDQSDDVFRGMRVDGLDVTPSYEPEAEALFARFTTPPTDTRKGQINTLIAALKAEGIWTKLDVLQVYAAADSQAARQNWIQDLYNATAVSSPTFTVDRGFAGNGTTSYVDTGFNPATASTPKYTQNSAYFATWSRTAGQIAASSAGWFDGVNGTTIAFRNATNQMGYRVNNATPSTTAAGTVMDGSGLFSGARNGTAIRGARNGTTLTNSPTVTSAAPANGSFRWGSVTAASFSTAEGAVFVAGSFLTESEEAALYTAINTNLVAVGAA